MEKVFTCLRCAKCCLSNLLIPLTLQDFYNWFSNRCYLPIILTVRECNEYTDLANIDWVYTLISSRHDTYMKVREILNRYGIKLPKHGCSLLNDRYMTCRVYNLRPLICRIFPFDIDLKISDWALNNCEAIKRGFIKPPESYRDIAIEYSKNVEYTYSRVENVEKIEKIRLYVFENFIKRIVKDRYDLETLRYILFNIVEYG